MAYNTYIVVVFEKECYSLEDSLFDETLCMVKVVPYGNMRMTNNQ